MIKIRSHRPGSVWLCQWLMILFFIGLDDATGRNTGYANTADKTLVKSQEDNYALVLKFDKETTVSILLDLSSKCGITTERREFYNFPGVFEGLGSKVGYFNYYDLSIKIVRQRDEQGRITTKDKSEASCHIEQFENRRHFIFSQSTNVSDMKKTAIGLCVISKEKQFLIPTTGYFFKTVKANEPLMLTISRLLAEMRYICRDNANRALGIEDIYFVDDDILNSVKEAVKCQAAEIGTQLFILSEDSTKTGKEISVNLKNVVAKIAPEAKIELAPESNTTTMVSSSDPEKDTEPGALSSGGQSKVEDRYALYLKSDHDRQVHLRLMPSDNWGSPQYFPYRTPEIFIEKLRGAQLNFNYYDLQIQAKNGEWQDLPSNDEFIRVNDEKKYCRIFSERLDSLEWNVIPIGICAIGAIDGDLIPIEATFSLNLTKNSPIKWTISQLLSQMNYKWQGDKQSKLGVEEILLLDDAQVKKIKAVMTVNSTTKLSKQLFLISKKVEYPGQGIGSILQKTIAQFEDSLKRVTRSRPYQFPGTTAATAGSSSGAPTSEKWTGEIELELRGEHDSPQPDFNKFYAASQERYPVTLTGRHKGGRTIEFEELQRGKKYQVKYEDPRFNSVAVILDDTSPPPKMSLFPYKIIFEFKLPPDERTEISCEDQSGIVGRISGREWPRYVEKGRVYQLKFTAEVPGYGTVIKKIEWSNLPPSPKDPTGVRRAEIVFSHNPVRKIEYSGDGGVGIKLASLESGEVDGKELSNAGDNFTAYVSDQALNAIKADFVNAADKNWYECRVTSNAQTGVLRIYVLRRFKLEPILVNIFPQETEVILKSIEPAVSLYRRYESYPPRSGDLWSVSQTLKNEDRLFVLTSSSQKEKTNFAVTFEAPKGRRFAGGSETMVKRIPIHLTNDALNVVTEKLPIIPLIYIDYSNAMPMEAVREIQKSLEGYKEKIYVALGHDGRIAEEFFAGPGMGENWDRLNQFLNRYPNFDYAPITRNEIKSFVDKVAKLDAGFWGRHCAAPLFIVSAKNSSVFQKSNEFDIEETYETLRNKKPDQLLTGRFLITIGGEASTVNRHIQKWSRETTRTALHTLLTSELQKLSLP